jgi:nucleotide-binding universal stress UspA family protein
VNTAIDPSRGDGPTIVVGVDGTSTALRAVEWAVAEARLRGVAMEILHAAPYAADPSPDLGHQRADAILARAYTVAHRAEPDVPVATRTSTDQPVSALLDASSHVGLLVVGMGGRGRASDLVIGSTALTISGRARNPVIVARGRRHPRDTNRPVAVGVDDVLNDAATLNFAFADARRHRGPIVVVHARHGAGQVADRISGNERIGRYLDLAHLARVLTPWTEAYPDVPIKIDMPVGHPSTALLGAAPQARLLVIGSRGRNAPSRALFGSTSREVLRRSPTPVAVLPPGVAVDPLPGLPVPARPEPAVPTGTGLEHPHDHGQLW